MKLIEKYREWVIINNPDFITRKVLFNLLEKFYKGEKEPLFEKMISLEKGELFRLCSVFKSAFDFFEINDLYVIYKSSQ